MLRRAFNPQCICKEANGTTFLSYACIYAYREHIFKSLSIPVNKHNYTHVNTPVLFIYYTNPQTDRQRHLHAPDEANVFQVTINIAILINIFLLAMDFFKKK